MRPASIKTIAQRAGVSPATVSRVLNDPNHKCSSPQTRNRIWKAARELRYVPNEAARNLKKGVDAREERTYFVNILMTRMGSSDPDPFFSELLHILEGEIHKNMCIASKIWYMPVFSNSKKCRSENIGKMVESMLLETEGKSDGLVVVGKCDRRALGVLQAQFRNVVSVNRNSTNYEVDEVTCDGSKIASQAVEHLISLGHREIGYVGSCHEEARYRGYQEALFEHGIDINADYVVETGLTEAEGYRAMKGFMSKTERPTGIYCASDVIAIGMLKYLGKMRGRYYSPSIIASDDINEAQFTKPMLTTVRLPKEEMGRFAIRLLMDRMRCGHTSAVRTEFQGRLIVRSSCKALAAD